MDDAYQSVEVVPLSGDYLNIGTYSTLTVVMNDREPTSQVYRHLPDIACPLP